jgi:hypothetical protein
MDGHGTLKKKNIYIHIYIYIYIYIKPLNGSCMKSIFVFQFDGDNQLTTDAKDLKFGIEIDHKHTYKLYMSIINKPKHANGADL